MVVHHLHNTFHQRVVIAFHHHILHSFLLFLRTCELAAQSSDIVDKVVDENMQFLHVERFGQISIRPLLESLHAIAHFRLRREQDNRDVANIGITLELFEERQSIHLRHHDIANHQVVII